MSGGVPSGPWMFQPYINQSAVLGCASGNSSEGTLIVLAQPDGTLNQWWQEHYQTWNYQDSYGFCPYHNLDMAFDCNNGLGNTCWLWGYNQYNANQNFYATWTGVDMWCWYQRASDGAYLTATGPNYNDTLTMEANLDGYNQWWNVYAGGSQVMTAEEQLRRLKKMAPPEAVKQRWERMRQARERDQRPKIADKPVSACRALAPIEVVEEVQKNGGAVEATSTSRRRCFHCMGALLLALLSGCLFLLGLTFGARWGK